MMGVKFLGANIFWASKSEMRKDHINVDIIPSQQAFRVVNKYLNGTLATENNRKCVIYGNTATRLEEIKDKVNNELNIPNDDNALVNIPGDALLITGGMEPELKLSHADSFTSEINIETCDFKTDLHLEFLLPQPAALVLDWILKKFMLLLE